MVNSKNKNDLASLKEQLGIHHVLLLLTLVIFFCLDFIVGLDAIVAANPDYQFVSLLTLAVAIASVPAIDFWKISLQQRPANWAPYFKFGSSISGMSLAISIAVLFVLGVDLDEWQYTVLFANFVVFIAASSLLRFYCLSKTKAI